MTDLELLNRQADTLFRHDGAGRLRCVNEPAEPEAPRFFLGRTTAGNVWRFRHDLPAEVTGALEALARLEPVPHVLEPDVTYFGALRDVLESHQPIRQIWSGPAYRFPEMLEPASNTVRITSSNTGVLEGHFSELRANLSAYEPCVAALRGGQAVAVCCNARTSAGAAEAGLETLAAFRGRGYAAAVVSGWAAAVREGGKTPLYSTGWENAASRGVARRLGLVLYGTDLSIL